MQKYLPHFVGIALIALMAFAAIYGIRHYAYQSAQFEQKAHTADSLRVVGLMKLHQMQDSLAKAQTVRDAVKSDLKTSRNRAVASAAAAEKVAPALPDTCQPTIGALKRAVDSLTHVADSAFSLYEDQKAAAAKLREPVQQVETALNASHEAIKAVPGRSFWAHLIPKLSAGAFGGVCTNGKPCAGIGVGLGWSL